MADLPPLLEAALQLRAETDISRLFLPAMDALNHSPLTDHPITSPPELVSSLRNSAPHGIRDAGVTREIWLINRAFAAGADQELEACCEWLVVDRWESIAGDLRAARRPKPASLKEQALALVNGCNDPHGDCLDDAALDTIRRALEQLND